MLPSTHRVLFALVISCSVFATAQREAVKNKAGDASPTKADPPAHAEGRHPGGVKKKADPASPKKNGGEIAEAGPGPADNDKSDGPREGARAEGKQPTAYDFGLPTSDGKNLPLSDFKGKVLLIVNLGRQSSYNAQLAGLQKLSDTFKDKGLVVIGVPSDDFGKAEPGTDADVAKFYADAKVSFPVMQRSTLTGVHQLPLFGYLASNKAIPDDGLHWNYTKFLVDRKGKVIVRFSPEVAPDSLEMLATVQEVLDGTWKPKKPSEGPGGRRGGGGEDGDGPM